MSTVLATQVKETSSLLRRLKQEVAARSNAGLEVLPSELLGISKLEVRLANLETFVRLRSMTVGGEPPLEGA